MFYSRENDRKTCHPITGHISQTLYN
jgi:hypothetical protein